MSPQEVGLGGLSWIDLAQDRERWWALVKCGNKLPGSIKFRKFLDQLITY